MLVFENFLFHTFSIKEMYMLIKYEDVANIFNENIQKSHFWVFSGMSHYFWTWSVNLWHVSINCNPSRRNYKNTIKMHLLEDFYVSINLPIFQVTWDPCKRYIYPEKNYLVNGKTDKTFRFISTKTYGQNCLKIKFS